MNSPESPPGTPKTDLSTLPSRQLKYWSATFTYDNSLGCPTISLIWLKSNPCFPYLFWLILNLDGSHPNDYYYYVDEVGTSPHSHIVLYVIPFIFILPFIVWLSYYIDTIIITLIIITLLIIYFINIYISISISISYESE